MQTIEKNQGVVAKCSRVWRRVGDSSRRVMASAHVLLMNQKGQGTTEYAILVGVLVVIAIAAIVVFRPKIQELWNAIADGIGKL